MFKQEKQSRLGIYLAITIVVIGVNERGVVTSAGCLEGVDDLLPGQIGNSFQPLCYDARHDGTSHAGPPLRRPRIIATVEGEAADIVLQDIIVGISFGIVAAEGSNDICAGCDDIGLDVACEGRTSTAEGRYDSVCSPVVFHPRAVKVEESCPI